MKTGFDNDKYLEQQSSAILERIGNSDNKLYLEFGGKLIFDYHASRVLPGFDPNVKMRLLQKLKERADVILCIYAGDIERRKVRADFGITYDVDALKLIDDLAGWDIQVTAVVITRYDSQPAAAIFKNKLERAGVKVYTHQATKGYPTNVEKIVSDEGYGANPHIETTRPLVVVTGPGPGSGKLATCLSQLYHDHRKGVHSGYAKFETFPIWNIPLKHPVNMAYEAATADIGDFNMVDPFHLEAYGQTAVNYNRDVEVFPVIKKILEKIMGAESVYQSPTDMGVNRAGFGIIDDDAVRESAKQEIIRRYFRYHCEYVMGFVDMEAVQKVEILMNELSIRPQDRSVVRPATQLAAAMTQSGQVYKGLSCAAAIELRNGSVVTGKNSELMHSASALVLNAIKKLAEIPDDTHILSPEIVESVAQMKRSLGSGMPSMDLEETLIALSISAAGNATARKAMDKLKELEGCEVHMTHIPTPGDEAGLRRLGMNLTSDANFASKSLVVM